MKIRTKITLSLLATSLISITVLSSVFFYLSYYSLIEAQGQKMQAIVSGKKSNLSHVSDAWQDRMNLIVSRTKLRKLFSENMMIPSQENIRGIEEILNDVLSSVHAVQYIEMCNLEGKKMVSVGDFALHQKQCKDFLDESLTDSSIRNLWLDQTSKKLLGTITTPIRFKEKVIGFIFIVFDGQDILDITHNYKGLGGSGETLLVTRGINGNAHFLVPHRRNQNKVQEQSVPLNELDSPMTQALLKQEITMISPDTVDYKGTKILASTAYISDLDWGLVTKIDRKEALDPVRLLLISLIKGLLVTSTVVVMSGLYLSRSITKPILNLVRVAQKVKRGENKITADTTSNDEIGELALSFNAMLVSLNDKADELEEFSYRTSHDLRSPLISAMGLLKVTDSAIINDDKEQAIHTLTLALSSLAKLDALAEDILTLAKAKNIKENSEILDANKLINEAIEKLSHLENFTRLDIQLNLQSQCNLVTKKSRLVLIIEI
jgi:signal transduction histidine kinase